MSWRGDRCVQFTDRPTEDSGALAESCSACGGDWTNVYQYQQRGEWVRGQMVSSKTSWVRRKWVRANRWQRTTNYAALRRLVENSEDTDTGTLYENLVAAALEPLMEAVLLVSQLCGTPGAESGDGATKASNWYHATLARDPVKPWEMRAMLRLGVERGGATMLPLESGRQNLGDFWMRWEDDVADEQTHVKVTQHYAEFSMAQLAHQLMLPDRFDKEMAKIVMPVEDEKVDDEITAVPSYKKMGSRAYPDWMIEEIRRAVDPEYDLWVRQQKRLAELARLAEQEAERAREDEVVTLDLAMFKTYYLVFKEGEPLPEKVDIRRQWRGLHRGGIMWPECFSAVQENGLVGGQLIGDCYHVEIDKQIKYPLEVCVPLGYPQLPRGQDADMQDFQTPGPEFDSPPRDWKAYVEGGLYPELDFADPVWVKPYRFFSHLVLPYSMDAKYGGLKVGTTWYKAQRRKVQLRQAGRVLCTSVTDTTTLCPIRRLNVSWLGLRSAPADCQGMDEVMHAVDAKQRILRNVEANDRLAAPYTQLGGQYATPDDFPAAEMSELSLGATTALTGNLAVYDAEDITQLSLAQADYAFKLGTQIGAVTDLEKAGARVWCFALSLCALVLS